MRCECGEVVAVPEGADGPPATCPACGRTLPPSPSPAPESAAPEATPAAGEPLELASCPLCFEAIQPGARKCPHCQEYLDPALAAGMRRPPLSKMALFAFVIGLVSPVFVCFPGPLALLLGLGALLRRRGKRGTGLAIAGLALGVVWTVVLVVMLTGGLGVTPPTGPSPAEPLF